MPWDSIDKWRDEDGPPNPLEELGDWWLVVVVTAIAPRRVRDELGARPEGRAPNERPTAG